MAKSPEELYKENEANYTLEVQTLKKRVAFIVILRLLSFLLAGILIFAFARFGNYRVGIFLGLISFIVFLFFVKKHLREKRKLTFTKELLKINKEEQKALRGDFSSFDQGNKYIDQTHSYAYDLDILGKRSLFQMVSRNALEGGRELTASILKGQEKLSDQLGEVQTAVKELSLKHQWRQHYQASGRLSESSVDEQEDFLHWMNTFPQPVLGKFYRAIRFILPVISCTLFVVMLLGVINFGQYLFFAIVPAIVMFSVLRRINFQYAQGGKNKDVIQKYSKLLAMIEDESFESSLLNKIQGEVKSSSKASAEIRKLNAIMSNFDNRNGIIVILLYLLFLSDIQILFSLERWIKRNKKNVTQWIEAMNQLDVLSGFGTFAFNYTNFTYPEISDDEMIKACKMGHPFLSHEEKCVTNDYDLTGEKRFTITTGANMAGKSTFLRSIGINLVMAKAGLPVFAAQFIFNPRVPLYTSMRTTDSLQDHESYFYTELKRLHELIEVLEKGEERFIILDEILKGTNSKDKALGSKKFIEKLLGLKASGIIATHDLSLCELAPQYPKAINNQCFEVDISGDQLRFDYKLRDGICQNMNATFLMTQMGII